MHPRIKRKVHFVVIVGILCGGATAIGVALFPEWATPLHLSTAVITTASNLIWALE